MTYRAHIHDSGVWDGTPHRSVRLIRQRQTSLATPLSEHCDVSGGALLDLTLFSRYNMWCLGLVHRRGCCTGYSTTSRNKPATLLPTHSMPSRPRHLRRMIQNMATVPIDGAMVLTCLAYSWSPRFPTVNPCHSSSTCLYHTDNPLNLTMALFHNPFKPYSSQHYSPQQP